MKKYSEDKFELKSPLSPDEIIDRLTNRTLKKKWLTMELTDKDFIGRIEQDTFTIFESSYPLPYGAACILNGAIDRTSHIILTTTLHKAFRVLFILWVIAMTGLYLVFWIQSPELNDLLVFIIGMTIGAFLFRLFLHGMYVMARNSGLKKMKAVLQIQD